MRSSMRLVLKTWTLISAGLLCLMEMENNKTRNVVLCNHTLDSVPTTVFQGLSDEDGGYICALWGNCFQVITTLEDTMYRHLFSSGLKGSAKCNLFGDLSQTSKFLLVIQPQSTMEAFMCPTTNYPNGELKIHMDVNNDNMDIGMKNHYNFVVCAWQHEFHNNHHTVCHHAILAWLFLYKCG